MRATILTLLAIPTLLLAPTMQAQSAAEQALVDLANKSRAEHSLKPLSWDAGLAKAAQAHLVYVVQHGGIPEHQYPGEPDLIARAGSAGAHFSTVAENIAGNAQDARQIHETWMSTPTHRLNLLDPKLTVVGIAVTGSPGALYAVEDFGRNVADLGGGGGAEKQVLGLLAAHGIQASNSDQARQDAKANCDSSANPPAGHPMPTLMMQWEGSDFTQLPPELVQRLPANPAKPLAAAVSSCTPKQTAEGFTTYRIAVLLY